MTLGNDPEQANATAFGIDTPGKVIAVHLNYPSRIAQRGRTPEFPSYFFKPASSLAPTGGTVERPGGHRAARVRGRDRARYRRGGALGLPRGRLGARRLRHGRKRPRPLRPPRCRQGFERPQQGRRRLHPDRPGHDPDRGHRRGRLACAHLGQRRACAGRHERHPEVLFRSARRRSLAAHDTRARRRDPHGHAQRARPSCCPAMSWRSRLTPRTSPVPRPQAAS